jgi:pyruvate formate lyase activating enzyme
MQISWINKFSMIEFPGKVSCVIFTPGCNLRCLFCHNPEFVLPELIKNNIESLISEDAFFTFLEKRKWLLDWVSICGWEPTLQKDLPFFCKKIKDMWFSVKLDTNWRHPKVIRDLLERKLIDYIAMDIKNPFSKYEFITWVKEDTNKYLESIEIIMNSDVNYEFRTTVIKWIHTNDDIEEIVRLIKWAKNYYLQNFRSGNTLKKDFEWKPFNVSELKEFKKIGKKYIEKVDFRE